VKENDEVSIRSGDFEDVEVSSVGCEGWQQQQSQHHYIITTSSILCTVVQIFYEHATVLHNGGVRKNVQS